MVKPIVSLLRRLRDYLVARMHIGHLRPGDQLPTYRELSRRWNIDHRMIARAYRALEAEGLVEIRGRSGVYLSEQERVGGEMLSETARWIAGGVLTEAWQRRIKIPDLPERIRRCTASVKLRTACIESTEDHRYLLCRELREWFGFDTHGVEADLLPAHDPDDGPPVVRIDDLPEAVRDADVLVTTTFHAHQVRPVAEVLHKPHVVVSMHPIGAEVILERLHHGPLTVVCVDPRFPERIRAIAGAEHQDRIHVVLASDRKKVEALDPEQPVLLTSAAQARTRRRLTEVLRDIPAFSPESAAELSFLLIRLNLEAASSEGAG